MKNNSQAPSFYLFTICNSVLFVIGICGFFLQNITLTAFSILLLSLLFFLYQFLQAPLSETMPDFPLNEPEDEPELGKVQLALEVQKLTEANEKLSTENNSLKQVLETTQQKTSSISAFYHCPLTTSIPIDIGMLLKNYIDEKKEGLAERNIHLSFQTTSEEMETTISTIALQIILDNIFDNILKFTPFGGFLYIRLAQKDTSQILLIFKNSCRPISSSDTERIFETNFQSSNHLLGTGLGLAQTRTMVHDFGGKIWTKSTTENCFTLYLQLPLHVIAKEA